MMNLRCAVNGDPRNTGKSREAELPELETHILSSVARQLMNRRWVKIGEQRLPVRRTSRKYLKIVNFAMNGLEYVAVEQNAAKSSYWAQLARKGHEVVQFIDVSTGRFVAVAVDGIVRVYRDMKQSGTNKAA